MTTTPSVVAVILAGGSGTRFWPVSRAKRPKQFLSISSSGESLLRATARRIEGLVGKDRVMVVTNELHAEQVKVEVPSAHIVCEPVARNTAASIGLAAAVAKKKFGDAVLVVLPADHAVSDEAQLRRTLDTSIAVARDEEVIVTIGIPPTSPHTGYGYIRRGPKLATHGFMVSRFYEKPNLERAKQYFSSGEFYWNSGMFAFRVSVIQQAMKDFLPEMAAGMERIEGAVASAAFASVVAAEFEKIEGISIDFGVLEHARNCAVVPAEPFGWNDVGSWDAWADHFSKDDRHNLLRGDTLAIDSEGCIVNSERKLTAILGCTDLVVIDAPDALLVCPRSRVQDVKAIVDELKARGRRELV